MPQYKCVPAPSSITVGSKGNTDDAVRSYANLINQEAVNGWIFHSQEEMIISQSPGCLMALLGQGTQQIRYNMLIFVKQ